MNFDLSDLRAFVAVADTTSFSAASEALHLSQPALSRRVHKLEDALGFRLFERTTRKVELNAMGRSFLPKARHVLSELEGALMGMADLSERIHGLVSIACVPSTVGSLLARSVKLFHQRYPRIRVRLLDQPAPDILLSVARCEADFGISYLGTQEPDLEFETLLTEPFVLACRPDHPLARRRRVSWSDLADQECVALAPGSGNRMLIDQAIAAMSVTPRWICEASHVPALLSLVEAGVGIGVVPRFGLQGARDAALVGVPLGNPEVTRSIGVIRRRGQALSPAAQAFRDLLPTARVSGQGTSKTSKKTGR